MVTKTDFTAALHLPFAFSSISAHSLFAFYLRLSRKPFSFQPLAILKESLLSELVFGQQLRGVNLFERLARFALGRGYYR